MNFDNMPELHWKNGYLLFWCCLLDLWVLFGPFLACYLTCSRASLSLSVDIHMNVLNNSCGRMYL
jgi:hypothetical protein